MPSYCVVTEMSVSKPIACAAFECCCSRGACQLNSGAWPCRVNGQPLREGGYEVHAAFGPFRAHECAVDAVAGLAVVAVGAVTEITVVPQEDAEAGRVFSGTEVVQAHVTGEAALAGVGTLGTLYAKTCTCINCAVASHNKPPTYLPSLVHTFMVTHMGYFVLQGIAGKVHESD